jgi:HD-like signal output (HDOD) protein
MTAASTPAMAALARYEDLPSQAGAATTVLRLVEDPNAGVADLTAVIGTDPALAARIMRVANSSYYGLSGRVATLTFAVSVIGFQAIRGLAVTAAASLDGTDATPSGFWQTAATTAAAGDLLAPMLGAHPGDAFSLGLLHTLGAALLHQHHPLPALCLPGTVDETELAEQEVSLYGIGHAEAAARVLTAWRFPGHLCELIASHHEPVLPDATPLQRLLPTARALTHLTLADHPDHSGAEKTIARLTHGKIAPDQLPPLIARLDDRAHCLHESLTLS